MCLRLISEKCGDFLNQYLDKVIVHMLKIMDKSLIKIRMANCVHCAHWRVDVYILIGTNRTDESDRYGLCVIISVTNCVFENVDLT